MEQILEQVFTYVRGAWRYRWYSVSAAWLLCCIGWFFIHQLPNQYESSTRVEVNTESFLQPLLSGIAFDLGAESEVAMLKQTLLTTPNLETIARAADLHSGAKDEREFSVLIEGLRGGIRLQDGIASDYFIRFTHENPDVAHRVVEATLNVFLEAAANEGGDETSSAVEFLDQQITAYELRVSEAERQILEFRRKHSRAMPARGQNYYQWMESVRMSLDDARLALRQAKNKKLSIERQLHGEEPTFGFDTAPTQRAQTTTSLPIDGRIEIMEKRLDEMLLNYTEQHPDVTALRDTLDQLNAQRNTQISQWTRSLSAVSPTYDSLNSNPVYQQMKISMSQEDANIAALEVEVGEYEERFAEVEHLLNTVPEVEAQFNAINRDYELAQRRYQALRERREAVELAERADVRGDETAVTVLESPSKPVAPKGPPRLVFYSAVLIASLGAGVALALMIFQLRPTYDTVKKLSMATRVPVFGSIDLVLSPGARLRRRMNVVAYFMVAVGLAGLYAGLVAEEVLGIRLLPDLALI